MRAVIIGIFIWGLCACMIVWAMFFPSQRLLKSTAKRASIAINYARSLKDGILISEEIDKTRFSSGRIVFLLDDGTLYSRYFNKSVRIRGVSGNLLWTSQGSSFELPSLQPGPEMKSIISKCGPGSVLKVQVDSLGYLLVTKDNGEIIKCNPGYGAGTSPFNKEFPIISGSLPVRLENEEGIYYLTISANRVSGKFLYAKIAETSTDQDRRQYIFIEGEPLIEFQKSLCKGSVRYLGRYSSKGTRWEIQLGSNENEVVRVNNYFLRNNLLIILGCNHKSQTRAVAITVETGKIQWEKKVE